MGDSDRETQGGNNSLRIQTGQAHLAGILQEKRRDTWKGGRSAIWRLNHFHKGEAGEVFGRLVKGKAGNVFPGLCFGTGILFFMPFVISA